MVYGQRGQVSKLDDIKVCGTLIYRAGVYDLGQIHTCNEVRIQYHF